MLHKKQQRLAGWSGLAVVAFAAFFLFFSPIHVAASQIHFDIDTLTSGTISWKGEKSDPLVGTNIQVDQVMGIDTPLNSGAVHDLPNGLLNFTTGALVSKSYSGNVYTFSFGPGGSLTLTGDVPGTTIVEDTQLIKNGSFILNEVTCVEFSPFFPMWSITFASFTDEKDDALLDYYGMPVVPYNGQFNISFEVPAGTNPLNGFTSSAVLSGDISNYPEVPIPAAVWLLGSSLIGLVVVRRRFVKS